MFTTIYGRRTAEIDSFSTGTTVPVQWAPKELESVAKMTMVEGGAGGGLLHPMIDAEWGSG